MHSKSKPLNKVIVLTLITFLSYKTQVVCGSNSPISIRKTTNINREWKFQLGDHPDAEKVGYTDTDWQSIGYWMFF